MYIYILLFSNTRQNLFDVLFDYGGEESSFEESDSYIKIYIWLFGGDDCHLMWVVSCLRFLFLW
jgi:hypothetical protein